MKLILLGPPGSGKGTQAQKLVEKYNLKHISTGEILRAEQEKPTEKGKLIKSLISNGKFVPDNLINELLQPYLCDNYILDGYPRNLAQAKRLKTDIDSVIFLELTDEECVTRIVHRPGGRLDDNETVARERLGIYFSDTLPVVKFYENKNLLVKVNACNSITGIFADICKVLDKIKK